MPRFPLLMLLACACVPTACSPVHRAKELKGLLGKGSPLQPITLPPDGVALDVFFATRPLDDDLLTHKLWEEADEQILDPELRSRLERNGFRVALAGDPMPHSLEVLMGLDEEQREGEEPQQGVPRVPMQSRVSGQYLILRDGRHTEIQTSDLYDSCEVLLATDGALKGSSFHQAQCVLRLTPHDDGDGKVRLEFVPEIQHGQVGPQFIATPDIAWAVQHKRPSRVFNDLAWNITLVPGETALVACHVEQEGTLGHYFFTQPSTPPQQKLLAVRLNEAAALEHLTIVAP